MCEPWRDRSQPKLPDPISCRRRSNSIPRIRSAVDSSFPDEIHWRDSQGCLSSERRVPSHRHSRRRSLPGKSPITRNGRIPRRQRNSKSPGVPSGSPCSKSRGTTSPRDVDALGCETGQEYQFTRANAAPSSRSPIQVPPPGSLGARRIRSPLEEGEGGSEVGRVHCSSRFMARRYPPRRGQKVTVHIRVSVRRWGWRRQVQARGRSRESRHGAAKGPAPNSGTRKPRAQTEGRRPPGPRFPIA